jgi:anti-sigma regulatory factor (Ser/Thr protein kinase)
VTLNDRWVSVHPVVLAATASAALAVLARGGRVKAECPDISSIRYLERMKLYEFLGITSGVAITEHEAAGRFIPLSQIRNVDELGSFLIDMVPLLHATPEDSEAIQYVVSELVRNVLEHSASPVGAVVCAQYYKNTNRVAIGVADAGIGILESMQRSHPVSKSLDAISLAMQPGVSGTTSRPGGTDFNAGAGLFFCKAIASASENTFVIYSGDALFKLRRADDPNILYPDPAFDRATRHTDVPIWNGTVVGIDVAVEKKTPFSALLRLIRDAYALDVKASKVKVKKARFG